ncbi:Hsp20/alpha crystallin family protein [Arcobacteraceae bacterium]|nr:Hsp20/alpha crystallin family protein [Arcobacteraceae bacterium]
MKNKFITISLGLALTSVLCASPLFPNKNENNHEEFHNQMMQFSNDDDYFSIPYKHHKMMFANNYPKMMFANNYPKMNLFENNLNYIFEFELAGVDKKDIEVTINEQNILKISGKIKELSKKEKENIMRHERYYGSFTRSLSLPDDINNDKIKVEYINGILKVIVNKDTNKAKKKSRVLNIN